MCQVLLWCLHSLVCLRFAGFQHDRQRACRMAPSSPWRGLPLARPCGTLLQFCISAYLIFGCQAAEQSGRFASRTDRICLPIRSSLRISLRMPRQILSRCLQMYMCAHVAVNVAVAVHTCLVLQRQTVTGVGVQHAHGMVQEGERGEAVAMVRRRPQPLHGPTLRHSPSVLEGRVPRRLRLGALPRLACTDDTAVHMQCTCKLLSEFHAHQKEPDIAAKLHQPGTLRNVPGWWSLAANFILRLPHTSDAKSKYMFRSALHPDAIHCCSALVPPKTIMCTTAELACCRPRLRASLTACMTGLPQRAGYRGAVRRPRDLPPLPRDRGAALPLGHARHGRLPHPRDPRQVPGHTSGRERVVEGRQLDLLLRRPGLPR